MAARPAVVQSFDQKTGGFGAPRAAPHRVRNALSRQEGALLGGAFAFAFLAVAASLLARTAPAWPESVPVLGIGLAIFALGGGAGISAFLALRTLPESRKRTPPIAAHFLALLEASPNGIAIWDRNDHLLRANERYTDFLELASANLILGAPREAIKAIGGRPLDGLLHEGRDAIRNGRGAFAISRFDAPGGDTIEILIDVTDLQGSEEALAESAERVHHLNEEMEFLRARSDHFAEEAHDLEAKLGTERRRADTANNVQTEFLSHMSHELRTPLNAILGFADMMRGRFFGPLGHEKYAEYAEDIYSSGEQLLNLISGILDVSEIQSGEVALDRQHVDLGDIIAECLTSIRPRIYASGISLIENLDHLPHVQVDADAVRQILMHILSNAMKFTPTGGRISLKSETDLNQVTLIIDDTGIGITPEIMERLDQPFAMTDQSALVSTDEGTGMGVGLSVSRGLARLNGGTLTLESVPGYGTTVRISLPRQ